MNQPAAPEARERWTYLGLSVFLAVLWFATLSLRPLFNPDEGRYAEIAREMLSGGDWIVPHLNGLTYIEKPPLQYWATALALRVFGQSEFAARFYTACCALAPLHQNAAQTAKTQLLVTISTAFTFGIRHYWAGSSVWAAEVERFLSPLRIARCFIRRSAPVVSPMPRTPQSRRAGG